MSIVQRFKQMRDTTRALFDLLEPEAFDARPIALRHPLRFYEGHLAAFNANQLKNARLIEDTPSEALSAIFARGIDPPDTQSAAVVAIHAWPERKTVREYIEAVDEHMATVLARAERPDVLHTCIEHEEMHQETLIYLLHQLPYELKRRPAGYTPPGLSSDAPVNGQAAVPGGVVELGAAPGAVFGWDNEYPRHTVAVAEFRIDVHKVTNADFLAFVEAGGYADERLWSAHAWAAIQAERLSHPQFLTRRDGKWYSRGMFELIPLPADWPVMVSYDEAAAYAAWAGARLPTEAEYHRAAYFDGATAQQEDEPSRWDFSPVHAADQPVSSLGIVGMTTNGWEWTSTPFRGFAAFEPMSHYPGYSADFFDGRHFVVKGSSPVTPAALRRPSFRNWYRDSYRFAYTTFRCVRE